MHTDKTQTPIKILNKFNDVVSLNDFIARSLERIKLVYKTSVLTGLWQLDLLDPEDEGLWSVGHYVDGADVEYDVTARLRWHGYVVERIGGEPHIIWTRGGFIFIALPHERRKEVVIVVPQICKKTDPLLEPVYIWRDAEGYLNVLDCGSGLDIVQRS